MAAIPFQIEVVAAARGMVIARRLEPPVKIKLGPSATLGGAPVIAMAMPPAIDPDTAMRDDLYIFQLARAEDASRLEVGEIVQLADWRPV